MISITDVAAASKAWTNGSGSRDQFEQLAGTFGQQHGLNRAEVLVQVTAENMKAL